jgi:general secretion pathway protein I
MPRPESGFSLLEAMIALAVFSLAVIGLLNLAGANTRTAGVVQERTLAAIVADNHAVGALTSSAPPAPGETSGEEQQGGETWRWREITSRTEDLSVLRIDIEVRRSAGPQVIGSATVFRSPL